MNKLKEIERNAIIEALEMSNWVQIHAAERLGINPRVLHYKIKTLRIVYPPSVARNGHAAQLRARLKP